MLDQWRDVRGLILFGDYYPLTSYSAALEVWMAWQYNRPDLREGVVQAFRRPQSLYETSRFKLRGLEPALRYTLTNLDTPGTTEATGSDLMEIGLKLEITDKPGSAIITYKVKT